MVQKRYEKLAFMKAKNSTDEKFTRMTGFTELEKSLNPENYERKYIDEKNKRSDVVAYAPEYSFTMDRDPKSEVSNTINKIFEEETLGEGATIEILVVDFANEAGTDGSFPAIKRSYSVIPDSEGGENELTQSGTFKANGETVKGTASTTDEWQTATFTKATE